MPTPQGIASYKRFMSTGVCDCGNAADIHADTFEEIKTSPINCKLTKGELMAWHTPRDIGGVQI